MGLAQRQPGAARRRHRPRRRPTVAPPDARQAIRLIETATKEDPELGLFLVLAVMLGTRRGELCSLRWTDVDFDHGEVLIDSGVIYVPGQPLIDQDRTKTHTKRRVAVGPGTLELLRAHRVEQAKVALACRRVARARRLRVQPRARRLQAHPPRWRLPSVRRARPAAGGALPAARPAALHGHPPRRRRRRRAHGLRAEPGTSTAAGRRSAPTRTSSTRRTARRPS